MDMVERMARAIWRDLWTEDDPEVLPPERLGPALDDWSQNRKRYLQYARAALKALETPTDEMTDAARVAIMETRGEPKDVISDAVWTAMIRAATGGSS